MVGASCSCYPQDPLLSFLFFWLAGSQFSFCYLVVKLCPNFSAAPWTVARQTPLFVGFSRQEYRSGLPFPSPGDLPDPGIESPSLHWQVDSFPLRQQGSPLTTLHLVNNSFFFWGGGYTVKPAGSARTLSRGSTESQPLDCQGFPKVTILF